jgi:hypothetical protein
VGVEVSGEDAQDPGEQEEDHLDQQTVPGPSQCPASYPTVKGTGLRDRIEMF